MHPMNADDRRRAEVPAVMPDERQTLPMDSGKLGLPRWQAGDPQPGDKRARSMPPVRSCEPGDPSPWWLQPWRLSCAAALAACPPTTREAERRLAAVQPQAYSRTRNQLDGAVTGLSPYVTHGLLPLTRAASELRARYGLDCSDKLIQEFGWRAYGRHVWRHAGDGIFQNLHDGPLPEAAYCAELPADVRHGCTGVPVIDRAVRTLYASGSLHNHARMWLASYLVHARKVHWRAGADWMWAHLLDGDLASNHLAWQWVAGTGSAKPYLFNAGNVARFAPQGWHSFGTVIDRDYPDLAALSRSPTVAYAEPGNHAAITPPALFGTPPLDAGFRTPDAADVADRDVWLLHPWSLGDPPAGSLAVAVVDPAFHDRWPWSALRWAWLLDRLMDVADLRWAASPDVCAQALRNARSVRGVADPHLGDGAATLGLSPSPALFCEPTKRCTSFSAWWSRVEGFAG
jgi:deoxyribodipyrimidine photo-lyase